MGRLIMLDLIKTDEQAEVARVFKDVRERAVGFELAADSIDKFMDEVDCDEFEKDDAR